MFTRLLRQLIRIAADRRGGVSVMLALMLVPLVGVMGLATETASWYLFQRAAQNAADAAALAAATNNCSSSCGSFDYADEAKAVGTKYNFTSGEIAPSITTCSDGTTCYQVIVTKQVSVFLTRIVGYNGTSNSGYQTISAVSVAKPRSKLGFCMILGTSGLSSSGSPNADLGKCDVYSAGAATCSGHDMGIGTMVTAGAVGKNKLCGEKQIGGKSLSDYSASIPDYAALATAANIPTANQNCSSNTLSPTDIAKSLIVCSGDVTLSTAFPPACDLSSSSCNPNVATTASGGTVLVIRGGNLNLNGRSLSANGITIIFTNNGTTAGAGFIKDAAGALNISAPSSGTWSGVALYQDPRTSPKAPAVTSWEYKGNSPYFGISGLVYIPNLTLTLSGAINHAKNGYTCIGLYAKGLALNGTGSFFANPTSECRQAGLNLPDGPNGASRQALVL